MYYAANKKEKQLDDGTILPTAPQTIRFDNLLNKWSNAGLLGIGYGIVGGAVNKIGRDMGLGSVVPEVGKVKSIGKSIFVGGVLGGLFDDPVAKTNSTTSHAFNLNTNPQRLILANGSSGQDSTVSSFD